MTLLTKLAMLLTKTQNLSPRDEENSYRSILLSVAEPIGELLSDDFENVAEVFEFLIEEKILPLSEVNLLRSDEQFCEALEAGLSSEYDEYDEEDEEDDYPDYPEDYGSDDYNEEETEENTFSSARGM